MNENKNAVRKTVYMDEELERRCEILFGEAGAKSFSDFVSKALEFYIDKLITGAHGKLLTEELSQAIRDEVRPIASRLSKSLYRYAVCSTCCVRSLLIRIPNGPRTTSNCSGGLQTSAWRRCAAKLIWRRY